MTVSVVLVGGASPESLSTYTSLGFGDLPPASHLRSWGLEVLNGLLLIGWTASSTYLALERYWPLHASSKGCQRGRLGTGRP